jgi:hypothetical protein
LLLWRRFYDASYIKVGDVQYQPGPLLLFAVVGNPSGPTLRKVEGCRRKNHRGGSEEKKKWEGRETFGLA